MVTKSGRLNQAMDVALRSIAQPKRYILAACFMSIGGFLNGYDTGSIGAITVMPRFEAQVGYLTPTLRGLTVSLLLLAGSIPSLFAGLLADRHGHLNAILAGAMLLALGAALEAGTVNLAMLLVGRCFVGAAQGLYMGNLNVYICEIAPTSVRGTLVAMPQLFVTAGVCAGYFTCYGSIKLESDWQWRLPFVIQTILGGVLAVACILLPQSPRWLTARSRIDDARRSRQRLDLPDDEDPSYPLVSTGQERPGGDLHAPSRVGLWKAFHDLFRSEHRYRTILALFILGMVQLCGIDGVLYYAPTLFAQAGLPETTASFVASGVIGISIFAISIPALLLTDKIGRRTIVIAGGIVLTLCMLVIGSLYASNQVLPNIGAGRWVVIVLIFVFAMAYAATWAIVGKIYATEIQPERNRAMASAIAQALNFLTNFFVAFITPIFLAKSSSGPYFLFAGLTLGTLAVLWLAMPETMNRSLEAITQEEFVSPMQSTIQNVRDGLRRRTRRHSVLPATIAT